MKNAKYTTWTYICVYFIRCCYRFQFQMNNNGIAALNNSFIYKTALYVTNFFSLFTCLLRNTFCCLNIKISKGLLLVLFSVFHLSLENETSLCNFTIYITFKLAFFMLFSMKNLNRNTIEKLLNTFCAIEKKSNAWPNSNTYWTKCLRPHTSTIDDQGKIFRNENWSKDLETIKKMRKKKKLKSKVKGSKHWTIDKKLFFSHFVQWLVESWW